MHVILSIKILCCYYFYYYYCCYYYYYYYFCRMRILLLYWQEMVSWRRNNLWEWILYCGGLLLHGCEYPNGQGRTTSTETFGCVEQFPDSCRLCLATCFLDAQQFQDARVCTRLIWLFFNIQWNTWLRSDIHVMKHSESTNNVYHIVLFWWKFYSPPRNKKTVNDYFTTDTISYLCDVHQLVDGAFGYIERIPRTIKHRTVITC
jgi:hypothetical protein